MVVTAILVALSLSQGPGVGLSKYTTASYDAHASGDWLMKCECSVGVMTIPSRPPHVSMHNTRAQTMSHSSTSSSLAACNKPTVPLWQLQGRLAIPGNCTKHTAEEAPGVGGKEACAGGLESLPVLATVL